MAPAETTAVSEDTPPEITENFAELLDESMGPDGFEGRVVKGIILAVDSDAVLIDVGLKSEGRIPRKEFAQPGQDFDLDVGDSVDVFVERYEDRDGVVRLSREKARREEAWTELEKAFTKGERVNGVIFSRVKGGFIVDLSGAVAFLPGSQVDIRPVRDIQPLMGNPQPFQILKMDAQRNNIVVSRRAVLEETRTEARSELISNLAEGQVLEGVVKNITDYGAFVELEPGVEGLVHVSEMSWTKKNVHPGKIVSTSQEVEVMVLDADRDKRRISLGLKQCMGNPWEDFVNKYPVGAEVEGEVKNITEFGLFIGLEGEIDGMAHLSDLAWDKTGEEALTDYKKGDMVKAKVLDVDVEKERISLGVKQLSEDPVEAGFSSVKKGDVVTCTVSAVVDNGIEVRVDDMPGFIRKGELSRERSEQRPDRFAAGEKVDAKITQLDKSGRKLTLSIKALEVEEEKKAMATYGSSDAGASLGDILGAALEEKRAASEKADETAEEKPAKKKAAKKKADDEPEAEAEAEAAAETEEEKPAKKTAAKKNATKKDAEAKEAADDAAAESGDEEKPAKKAAAKKKAPAKKKAAAKKDEDAESGDES